MWGGDCWTLSSGCGVGAGSKDAGSLELDEAGAISWDSWCFVFRTDILGATTGSTGWRARSDELET